MSNKLIGTNPNQTPSNADLGSSAFLDAKELLLAKNVGLTEVYGKINANARAVFVYDTTKDSDGGAWRHKCQNTSWYNEELNTDYRGKRKEFPSMALIVAEDGYVYIYDCDSPTLDLWMKFVGAAGNLFGAVTGGAPQNVYDMYMLNGELVWGVPQGNAMGPIRINFISEEIYWYYTSVVYRITNPISERNDDQELVSVVPPGAQYLNTASVRRVTMKVLKGAPINPKTGLSVPTIALGTDDGISIIRDWGGPVGAITNLNYSDTYTGSSFIAFNDKPIPFPNG